MEQRTSGKWDNLERLTKISEMNFSKINVSFNFEPEFPEIVVEWITPFVFPWIHYSNLVLFPGAMQNYRKIIMKHEHSILKRG